MTRITSRSWTETDIARLIELSRTGASVTRASAALNRKMLAVRIIARREGLPLVGLRQSKAAIRRLAQRPR